MSPATKERKDAVKELQGGREKDLLIVLTKELILKEERSASPFSYFMRG
jgi:hypothetical protein